MNQKKFPCYSPFKSSLYFFPLNALVQKSLTNELCVIYDIQTLVHYVHS